MQSNKSGPVIISRLQTNYLVLFISVAAFITAAGYILLPNRQKQIHYTFSTELSAPDLTTQVSPTLRAKQSFQPSPDGTNKVIMDTLPTLSGPTKYTFSTSDGTGENKKEIYSAALTEGSFTLPFNSFSPDNRYFFIQKQTGEAYVFRTNGDPVTPAEQFFDVRDIFTSGDRKDLYKLVTGWASPTLLIINTTKEDGTKGNSYWFEVPSKAIIELWGDF